MFEINYRSIPDLLVDALVGNINISQCSLLTPEERLEIPVYSRMVAVQVIIRKPFSRRNE